MATTFTRSDVSKVASLANIPVSEEEKAKLAEGFNTVMKVLDQLRKVDVSNIAQTNQVTGFTNVFREDVVEESRMFTQDEALANAPRKYNGYFLTDQVIDSDV